MREERAGGGLFLGTANDGQDVQEDVDNVRVEVEGRKDILLLADGQLLVPQDQLCVHRQELQQRSG